MALTRICVRLRDAALDLSLREARQDDGEDEEQDAAGDMCRGVLLVEPGDDVSDREEVLLEEGCVPRRLKRVRRGVADERREQDARQRAAGDQPRAEERAGAQIRIAGLAGLSLD